MTDKHAVTAMRLLLIAMLSLVTGCALVEDRVTMNYNPPANLAVIQNAQALPISVQAQDGRASNKDRISSKKNGYGMEMARIVAANDVVQLVRDAVEHELTSFGFPPGPGGLKASVDLQTFYNDFKIGFFSGDAVAEVAFNLIISNTSGAMIYARSYKGVGMNRNVLLAQGREAQPALQEALTNAMQDMISDAGLQAALQQSASHTQQASLSEPRSRQSIGHQ
jgi:uncharacterized lipoprotein YajG